VRGEAGPAQPLCRISGGETTVEVTGHGLGGRCQELAALALPRLDARTVFLAAGSDGNDGPTDAAGGVVDAESWARVQREGIPYDALLADHDSYRLLERSGNQIKVPPTRNNVMDVHLFLAAAGK
jgi:hydroxypyruvate reductase